MASLEDLTPEARDELASLARELADNKDTRADFLRLTKRARPNVPVPEIDIEDRVAGIESRSAERISELEGRLKEKEAKEELNRRRRVLLDKKKVEKDEDVAEVEKIMLEKGITNHETAADYWSYMRQAATPTPTGYNANVMDTAARATLSKYWKNPQVAARDEAAKALQEIRKNPKPVGF
jgi:hypothetical protein